MDKTQVTDELLYKYMPLAGEEILKELEQETDRTYSFSDKFDRKMKKLMRREAHPQRYAALSVAKKAAIVFVGAVSAFMAVTMSVKAYRTKFFETIRRFGNDYAVYNYQSNTADVELLEKLVPTYIPEGYEEVKWKIGDCDVELIYENGEGERIIWRQTTATKTTFIIIDSGYDEKRTVDAGGALLELYCCDTGKILGYCERENYIITCWSDAISAEDVLTIFESMEEVKGK